MRGLAARWRVALRIARRSALASWGRSLLIVVLIAAPITGLTAAAVLLPSTQSTLAERIQGTLGHAQAVLTVEGRPSDHVRQGVEGGYDYVTDSDGADADDAYVDPTTVLPAGTRVLAIGAGAGVFATPNGATSLEVVSGPSWDRSLDGGPYQLLSGRRPAASDEILLSPAALTRLGSHVGGTVTLEQPTARTLRVVGTSRDRNAPSTAQTVFAATSVFPPDPTAPNPFTYYVPSTPIDWATVERLNAAGTTAFSRAVVTDPPRLPADRDFSRGWSFNVAVTAAIVIAVTFAVLEVALLAGAAFLVGARLQQRALATVASVGADRSVLRRIVTASGVVLGAIGGVAGVALGIGGALLLMRLTDDGTWSRYPGVHLIWPLLVGIAVFGVAVGWIAALLPARAASRFDVVRALRGARTPQRVGRRPVVGVVLLVVGIACTLLGTGALVAALKVSGGDGTWAQIGALALLGGGPVIAQLGVILCAGLLLRGLTRLLERAPLPARLAARDTSRNLGRAVPAVASVMTTVFVAAFVMCIANTSSQQAAVSYYWRSADIGGATSSIAWTGSKPPTAAQGRLWADTLERTLPVASAEEVGLTPMGTSDEKPSDRARDAVAVVRFPEPASCTAPQRRDPEDLRCGTFTAAGGAGTNAQAQVTIGDAAALGLLLGHSPSAAALRSLAAGGGVALRSTIAPSGTATLDWFTPKQISDGYETAHPTRSRQLPTVTDLPTNPIQTSLFVTPGTARTLGLTYSPDSVVMSFRRAPTDAELDAANAALGALANAPGQDMVDIETGPQDIGSLVAWYVLLACMVIAIAAGATAIGLARVDGRPDDLTLASLGASPRIRRSVALVQGLIVCGLGAVLGTVLGMLPAIGLGGATESLPFAPPPLQLALMAVGIPIVIAAGSWLLVGTRRGDLTRRSAIA